MAIDEELTLCPCFHAQLIVNGVPAVGYRIIASDTVYKSRDLFDAHATPILINEWGFPSDPIFILINNLYDFAVLPPVGSTPLLTIENVISGSIASSNFIQEWYPNIPAKFVSSSSVSVVGNQRDAFSVGRRVMVTYTNTTDYGTITKSDYDGSSTIITLQMDVSPIGSTTLVSIAHATLKAFESVLPFRRVTGLTTRLDSDVIMDGLSEFNLLPPGLILPIDQSSLGNAWSLSNGQALSRTQYARLFSALGTTFGAGNGSTTFNVPNIPSLIFGASAESYGILAY